MSLRPLRITGCLAADMCAERADRLVQCLQGSPLLPDDLRGVNVEEAHAMVIVSDNSRCEA